jgi:hypothetical protein
LLLDVLRCIGAIQVGKSCEDLLTCVDQISLSQSMLEVPFAGNLHMIGMEFEHAYWHVFNAEEPCL